MATPTIINGDWSSVRQAIRYLDYNKFGSASSPVFGSLTIGTLSGILKATSGVVTGNAAHSELAGVTENQHHNKSHAHDGVDGSGTVAHSDLTGNHQDVTTAASPTWVDVTTTGQVSGNTFNIVCYENETVCYENGVVTWT